MTIPFAGGEMGAFIPSDGSSVEVTFSNSYETGFSRCALGPLGQIGYVEGFSFAAMDELWVHFAITDATTATNMLTLSNAAGTDLFRVTQPTSTTLAMQYWNGSAWQTAGSAFSINANDSLHHCDLFVSGNSATGSCSLYVAGTQRATAASVDLSAVASITKVRGYGDGSVSTTSLSQVAVSSESTIGYRLTTVPPTGAGATTDFTGGYTEVDEIVYSDADFINSATANQVELFSHGTAIPAGYRVKAVIVTARAKRGSASGPQNIQLALRSGGTTYFSSSQALSLGYGAHVAVWENDPATAAAFTASAIASLQFGVKSIA